MTLCLPEPPFSVFRFVACLGRPKPQQTWHKKHGATPTAPYLPACPSNSVREAGTFYTFYYLEIELGNPKLPLILIRPSLPVIFSLISVCLLSLEQIKSTQRGFSFDRPKAFAFCCAH